VKLTERLLVNALFGSPAFDKKCIMSIVSFYKTDTFLVPLQAAVMLLALVSESDYVIANGKNHTFSIIS